MSTDKPLSAKYYVNREYFDIEKESIFFCSWQCVCHVSEVADPGDFATFTLYREALGERK